MRTQRNIAQMKEQNSTPEKEPNKMESSKLLDAEFKTLALRMFKELRRRIDKLRDNFNSIKKDMGTIKKSQSEMKDILTEIKNIYRESTVQ